MPGFLASIPWPSTETFLIALPTLIAAYIIFGIAGFGTALIAAPLLAHVMPVTAIVPLLAILDCLAAIAMGVRLGDKVAKDELVRLVPLMIVGSLIGTYLLLIIPPRPMMLALGVFVVAYAIYSLVAPPPAGAIRRPWGSHSVRSAASSARCSAAAAASRRRPSSCIWCAMKQPVSVH